MCPKDIDIPIETIIQFSKVKYPWKQIRLSGGEPLLHPKIDDVFDILKQSYSPIVLLTNGTIMKSVPNWITIISSNKIVDNQPLFQTFNVAPIDVGITKGFEKGCFISEVCGVSLSVDGLYYCCGAGATIAREFNLNIGCKTANEITRDMFNIVCKFCGHFYYNNFLSMKQLTIEQEYSESWINRKNKK
jgi:hypothetical protein